uniref:Uncharacterized protein n=1 Tax=Tardiphaga robiniae TaxID=943830 RepID=A0A109ZY52_9BRAD|nr:hypothetical protein PROKKA_00622 [Tardiphaga robiniae]
MEVMDRRNLLQGLLFSAVATGLGTSVFLTTAKAAPIPLQKDLANKLEPLTENAQVVVVGRPPRRVLHRPHRSWRRRRRVCWWRHGRRVCAWR